MSLRYMGPLGLGRQPSRTFVIVDSSPLFGILPDVSVEVDMFERLCPWIFTDLLALLACKYARMLYIQEIMSSG